MAGGTQTSAIAFGGQTPPSTGVTEFYDGTTWTTNPATMSTARGQVAGTGTQSAAFAAGGGTPANKETEEFDGGGATQTEDIDVT